MRVDPLFIRKFDKARNDNLGRCGVFAGRLNLQNKFGYVQTIQLNELILGKQEQEVGIKVALCVEGLVLLTVFVDRDLDYTFELVEGLHQPVWPGRGHKFKPIATPTFTGNALDLKLFADELDVAYSLGYSVSPLL